jgi:hypothetical protein
MEAEREVVQLQTRKAKGDKKKKKKNNYSSQEEARKDSSIQISEGQSSFLCLDFGFPTSRSVR